MLVLFFPLVMMLIAFTYGILKIPSLVNSLFTGRSGEIRAAALVGRLDHVGHPMNCHHQQDFAAGKRQYLELYGSVAVMNTYLKIALLPCRGQRSWRWRS